MIATNEFSTDRFYSKKVGDLHFRNLRVCSPDTPIFQVAQNMAKEKVSIFFIAHSEKEILGFVTDITLRDKVVANQLPYSTPVGNIMDKNIIYIQKDAFLYEALLMMFQTKTRYLLVRDQGRYVGWISRNKILSEQSQGPFIFIQAVRQAMDRDELKEKWAVVPAIIHQLVEKGLKAQIINQIITAVTDTISLRIIENTIRHIGPPPAKFVFFVLGSEGRA